MIASLSGIRGIPNEDLSLEDVSRFAQNFAMATNSDRVLLGRDPRASGPMVLRAAAAGMMSRGVDVLDCGILSTPALFRQSRVNELPALMVSASHNEPQFNGMKFIVNGTGIGRELMDAVLEPGRTSNRSPLGVLRPPPKLAYVDDLVRRFGAGTAEGVKVALDLGGGAAISHAPRLLKSLGCDVVSLNDAYGVFSRRVDPVADDLDLLRRTVVQRDCDIGLGFDCDGDRLVIVDSSGKKRSGDFMLTLALAELLKRGGEKKVVVSLDTTQAVDDVAREVGAEVFRARVGEANVVEVMNREGATLGGEGSSGGLIDGKFNYCRDSMLAAIVVVQGIKRDGRKLYGSVPSYHQERTAVQVPRQKAVKGIKKISALYKGADVTDGVK
ncbi:MAG TPA: hypothetical protein VEB67_02600, partial [Nitrososphaerales archaeon]|nr:hypothetical protein [Nitrososphaerales archaeon]